MPLRITCNISQQYSFPVVSVKPQVSLQHTANEFEKIASHLSVHSVILKFNLLAGKDFATWASPNTFSWGIFIAGMPE